MRKKGARLRRALAAVLALALLLPLSGQMGVTDVSATLEDEIAALRQSSSALKSQKAEIAAQLKAVRADKNKALEQKSLIEQQINVIQSEINNISNEIELLDLQIGEKTEEMADTEAREKKQYELFCQRIRQMEEEGQTSYWAILFDSSDFADLLDRFMMIEEIIQYDNGVMESLIALRQQLEVQRTELETAKAEQEEARQAQEQARQEQKAREAEVDALIEEIKEKEDELAKKEAALRAAANAADAEIKRKEREMAAQIKNVVSESGFMWPLSAGINTLSSLYGPRTLFGKADNHTGIDIPAARGTTIMAAKSGVVTTSVYGSGGFWSYGNFVVVSHSDGTSTLYAHMSRRSVSEGQTVSQGQKIGEVGTTGNSTGNHLHFEVRRNGRRTDPIDYFPDKTLYYYSSQGKVVIPH